MTLLDKYESLPKEPKSFYQMDIIHLVTTKKLFKPAIITEHIRTVYFNSCIAGNMSRIAKEAILLPDALFGNTLRDLALPHIADNLDKLIYIIASGIQNNRDEPGKELLEFIKNNFDHEQILESFNYTMNQLGMQSFINCLVIAKGSKIIKSEGTV